MLRLASLLAVLLMLPLSAPAAGAPDRRDEVRVRWQHAHVEVGRKARAVVRLGDHRGTVRLQRRTLDRWHTVRTVRHPGRRVTLRIPTDFYSRMTYRVRVGRHTVDKRRIVVRPRYQPRSGARHFAVVRSNGLVPRWNPCAPIRFQVNDAQATRGAVHDVRKALRRLGYATGLRFEYAGRTELIPTDVLGAPSSVDLVVAWATADQTPLLDGVTAGRGGGVWASGYVDEAGRPAWRRTAGYVVLDSRQNDAFVPGFRGGRHSRGMLLMHELGHAVGLEHSTDPRQVMFPSITTRSARYAAGDLRGLRRLGAQQGCLHPAQPAGG